MRPSFFFWFEQRSKFFRCEQFFLVAEANFSERAERNEAGSPLGCRVEWSEWRKCLRGNQKNIASNEKKTLTLRDQKIKKWWEYRTLPQSITLKRPTFFWRHPKKHWRQQRESELGFNKYWVAVAEEAKPSSYYATAGIVSIENGGKTGKTYGATRSIPRGSIWRLQKGIVQR